MGDSKAQQQSRGGTEEDAIDTFMDYLGSKFWPQESPTSQKLYVRTVLPEAKTAIQSLLAEARKDELEWLLDAQDQELDLDNRPIGEAYHVINDGTEHLINERLKQSAAQGKE